MLPCTHSFTATVWVGFAVPYQAQADSQGNIRSILEGEQQFSLLVIALRKAGLLDALPSADDQVPAAEPYAWPLVWQVSRRANLVTASTRLKPEVEICLPVWAFLL